MTISPFPPTVVEPRSASGPRPTSGDTATSRSPSHDASAERLRIVAWHDPVVDEHGHDPRSWYVETFWLGVLGPSTTWLLRFLAARFDQGPDGFELDLDDTARCLGLGGRTGKHAPFARAIGRCVTFDMARWRGSDTLAVRRTLPPLARRHLLHLPPSLQARHRQWLEEAERAPVVDRLRRRARRLALGLVDLGHGRAEVELHLVRWRVHPAIAHDAASWALAYVSTPSERTERLTQVSPRRNAVFT